MSVLKAMTLGQVYVNGGVLVVAAISIWGGMQIAGTEFIPFYLVAGGLLGQVWWYHSGRRWRVWACQHVGNRKQLQQYAVRTGLTFRRDWTPERIGVDVVMQTDVDNLSGELKVILEQELDAGNEIAETWRGWPSKETIAVLLKHPFRTNAQPQSDTILYRDLNDPKSWKSEYFDQQNEHLLGCKFQN